MERRPRWRDAEEGRGRLVLGFDGGCGRCTGLADRIRLCVGDRLEVGDLRSARARRWRGRALGEDAPFVPTLFEVRGRKVRAWVGIEMGLVLARRLGIADSLKVLRALGDTASTPEHHTGGVLAGGRLRPVRDSLADTHREATPAAGTPIGGARTPPPGSRERRRTVLGIVEGSRGHGDVVATSGAELDLTGAACVTEGEFAAVVARGSGRGVRAFAAFSIDLHRGTVDASRHLTVTTSRRERFVTDHRDGVPGEALALGDDYVVLPDGAWVTPEELEGLARQREPVRREIEPDVLYGQRARSGCLDRSYRFCMRVEDLYGASWREGSGLAPLDAVACDYLAWRTGGAAGCRAWARTRCYLGSGGGA